MALNEQCSSTESHRVSVPIMCVFCNSSFACKLTLLLSPGSRACCFSQVFDYPSDFNQCLIYFTGKMFPTEGHMYIAPFNDDALYQEQSMKPNFWCHQNFHGVDLTTLRMDSFEETFKQPIVVMCFH